MFDLIMQIEHENVQSCHDNKYDCKAKFDCVNDNCVTEMAGCNVRMRCY